jgi:hypothetical protein
MASMLGVHIIQGKPSPSAGLLAALVRRSEVYDFQIVEHHDLICALKFFRDGQEVGTSVFKLEDAAKAGLTSGRNAHTWRNYPRNMLFARAISNGVKWFCPDLTIAPLTISDEEVDDMTSSEVSTGERTGQPPVRHAEVRPPELPAVPHGVSMLVPRGAPTDRADGEFWRRTWFATVRGTDMDSDAARAAWLQENLGVKSLKEVIAGATNEQMHELIVKLAARVGKVILPGQEQGAGREAPPPTVAEQHAAMFGDEEGELPHGMPGMHQAEPEVEADSGWRQTASEGEYTEHEGTSTSDEPSDPLDVYDWAEGLRHEMADADDDFQQAERSQQKKASQLVMAALNDAEKCRYVLTLIVGDEDPAQLSVAACRVIEREAMQPGWIDRLEALAKTPLDEG